MPVEGTLSIISDSLGGKHRGYIKGFAFFNLRINPNFKITGQGVKTSFIVKITSVKKPDRVLW